LIIAIDPIDILLTIGGHLWVSDPGEKLSNWNNTATLKP
jgi:hypothetical protein